MSQISKHQPALPFPQNNQAASRVRWAVLIGGGALAVFGLTRRSKSGLALAAAGGVLAFAKAKGNSHPNRYSANATFAINCSREQAYRYWRDFENLPRFMRHLKSVKVTDGNRSEWTALGPADKQFSWTAEIIEDRENECISWQSTPGSQIENSGSVVFRPGSSGRGTLVTVRMAYTPPGGALGHIAAKLFGKDPQFTVREDMRHFKSLMEAGEVPTTLGQSHGPRGAHGRVERVLFREPQNQLSAQELDTPIRRTA